jgi:hypothetical protein
MNTGSTIKNRNTESETKNYKKRKEKSRANSARKFNIQFNTVENESEVVAAAAATAAPLVPAETVVSRSHSCSRS